MIPIEGADYPYYDGNCSLIVKLIKYMPLPEIKKVKFKLKPLRNLSPDSDCKYEIGKEFEKECALGAHGDGLWGLVMEGENL